MRKIMPLLLLMSILFVGVTVQGTVLGQATPTSTSTPTETATTPPTSTATETPTIVPTATSTETSTALPTDTPLPTSTETPTLTSTVETATPIPTETATLTSTIETATATGTLTETATAAGTLTPTATVETATLTPFPSLTPAPTLTALPTGLTRVFFFQGLANTNVDIYANGLQLGGNVETGRMVGPFVLLNGTSTTMLLFPSGNLAQPTLIGTLAFEPGSTVLVVAFDGPGGTPTLAVYRLDTAPGQSQLIAINASDAPAVDVVTSSYPTTSLAQGLSTQITLAPGNTAGLGGATGGVAAQNNLSARALAPGVAYVQIAVGSVANGTFRVITQAVDLNTLTTITP